MYNPRTRGSKHASTNSLTVLNCLIKTYFIIGIIEPLVLFCLPACFKENVFLYVIYNKKLNYKKIFKCHYNTIDMIDDKDAGREKMYILETILTHGERTVINHKDGTVIVTQFGYVDIAGRPDQRDGISNPERMDIHIYNKDARKLTLQEYRLKVDEFKQRLKGIRTIYENINIGIIVNDCEWQWMTDDFISLY